MRGRKTGGRQPGSRNKSTIERERLKNEARDKALADLTPEQIDRLTPRDVMALVMRTALRMGDLKGAFAAATELAPYQHARLSAQAQVTRDELAEMSDEQLAERLAQLRAGGGAAAGGAAAEGVPVESADVVH